MKKRIVRKVASLLLAAMLLPGLFAAIPAQEADAGSQYITNMLVGATANTVTVSFTYGKDTSDEDTQSLEVSLWNLSHSYTVTHGFRIDDHTDPRGDYSYTFTGLNPGVQYQVQVHGYANSYGTFSDVERDYFSDIVPITTVVPQAPAIGLVQVSLGSGQVRLKGQIISTGTGTPYDPDVSTRYQSLGSALQSNALVVMRRSDDPAGNLDAASPAVVSRYGPQGWNDDDNAFDLGISFFSLEPDTEYVAQAQLTNTYGLTGYSAKVYFRTYILPQVVIDEIKPMSHDVFIFATVTCDPREQIGSLSVFADDPDVEQPVFDPARIAGNLLSFDETTGEATFKLSGLAFDTAYDVQVLLVDSQAESIRSPKQTFTTLPEPTPAQILTTAATHIRSTKVKMNATISDTGYSYILQQGFLYSSTDMTPRRGDPDTVEVTVPIISQTAPVALAGLADNLLPGTTYYFQSFVRTNVGTSYGGVLSFKTLDDPEVMTLAGTTGRTTAGITLYGEVISTGGIEPTMRGFVYDQLSDPLLGKTGTQSALNAVTNASTGQFDADLTGLAAGTTYYYKAFIHSLHGTIYGEQRSFTTETLATILPSVTTLPILSSNVADTSADVTGSFTAPAGTTVSETGFVYSEQPNPMMSGSTTAFIPLSDIDGFFGTVLLSLKPDTTYFVRAYARNEHGYGYGASISFKTKNTIGAVPPELITAFTVDEIQATAITVTLETSGSPVAGKYILYSKSSMMPLYGAPAVSQVSYSFLDGDQKTINGLEPNTTYYLRGFTRKLDPILGINMDQYSDVLLVTTAVSGPPRVTHDATPVTDISASGATIHYELDPNGAPVTKIAVIWSSSTSEPSFDSGGIFKQEESVNISEPVDRALTLPALLSGKTYYYVIYALNADGWGASTIRSLTTTTSPTPEVEIGLIETSATSAVFSVDLVQDGISDKKIGYVGVVVGTTPDPTIASPGIISTSVVADGAGRYTVMVSGLNPSTDYYVNARAVSIDDVDYYSAVDTAFTTLSPLQAAVVLYGPDNIAATTTDFAVSIKSDGGNPVTAYGVVYDTAPAPDLTCQVEAGAAPATVGNHPVQLDGLANGTTYYARAYATTINGTAYSSNTLVFRTKSLTTAPGLNGTIYELEKENIEQGDLIYFGNLNSLPLSWHVVNGAGTLANFTLLAGRKVGDQIRFDSDPDGSGPLVHSNNYRDSDIRAYLNTIFVSTLSSHERDVLLKMRAFSDITGVATGNTVEDLVNGDFAYLPNESQITSWGLSQPDIRNYWFNYWSRTPDLSPYEGYVFSAGSSATLRVFVTAEYAPRPVITARTANIAAVFPVIADNTGKPWAVLADSTNYVPGTSGMTYLLGLLVPDELNITGVPTTPQIAEGVLVLDPLVPSVNDDTAAVKYMVYHKDTGSILKYRSIAADELSRLILDLSGLADGSHYVVRIWLQRDIPAASSEMSPYYEFDLTIQEESNEQPTGTPAATPTVTPTVTPNITPTIAPTATPTVAATATPAVMPTATPAAGDDDLPKTGELPNRPVLILFLLAGAAGLVLLIRRRNRQHG